MDQKIKPTVESSAFGEGRVSPDDNEIAAPARRTPLSLAQAVVENRARTQTERKPVTTLTLSSRNCKWPIGDPAKLGFHYCGKPPQSGRPYCDAHDAMSYQSAWRRSPPPGSKFTMS